MNVPARIKLRHIDKFIPIDGEKITDKYVSGYNGAF